MARIIKMKKVTPSTLLGIDSGMVIFHTDLDGLNDLGVPVPDMGGEPGSEPPPPQPERYIAVCHSVFHPPDMEGATEDGLWFGGYREQYDEAKSEAGGHLDGQAIVLIYVNDVLIGPVTQFP
jgi:hypothetical protein